MILVNHGLISKINQKLLKLMVYVLCDGYICRLTVLFLSRIFLLVFNLFCMQYVIPLRRYLIEDS
jgi:hypothetical protein